MFQLSSSPIDAFNLKKKLASDKAGAFASFEGWVRDHNEGRAVTALEYEAFEKLCQAEVEKIFAEVCRDFEIVDALCVHRIGHLKIGEMAVWVGVTAGHRDQAFAACRYIIDEVKKRLPIWKKEFYAGGETNWVNAAARTDPESRLKDINEYYSRQIILPEIGIEGQKKLGLSRVLVVGAGGLGSAALTSLAQAGIGLIGIVEFDQLQASNLHRQSLYSAADIGKSKCDLAGERLKEINPQITLASYPARLDATNIETIIGPYDVILDCTDNFAAKYLLNDAAVIYKKILIQASIYQWEGQLRVYDPATKLACLRCLWPQIPTADCVGSCAQVGVIGILPNVFGHLQAMETIKYILGSDERLTHDMLIGNLCTYDFRKIKQVPSVDCPVCGSVPSIQQIRAANYELDSQPDSDSIDLSEIPVEKFKQYKFIDIREEVERLLNPILEFPVLHFPLSRIDKGEQPFNNTDTYLIFCERGMRSLELAKRLHQNGFMNVKSLRGGTESIKKNAPRFAKFHVQS